MPACEALDITFSIISISMIVLYHVRWYKLVYSAADVTVFGAVRRVRRLWVAKMLSEEKHIINTIQMLRNTIMGASLLASSALILLAFLLGIVISSNDSAIDHLTSADPLFCHAISGRLKLLLLSLDIFLAFLFSVQAVRLNMQAGFFSAFTASSTHHDWALEKLTSLILKSGDFWTWSIRMYYLILPLAVWQFGTLTFLISCLCVVGWLYYVDILLVGSSHVLEQLPQPNFPESNNVGSPSQQQQQQQQPSLSDPPVSSPS